MIRTTILLWWLCWYTAFAAGQAVGDKGPVFDIRQTAFAYEQYKWGNELFVVWQGRCPQEFAAAVVTLSLAYSGQVVRREQLRLDVVPALSPGEPSVLAIRWGPINEPCEAILAGEYEATLGCTLEQQPMQRRSQLQNWLAQPLIHSAKLYWQTPEIFAQEERRLRAFYGERLARLQQLTANLLRQTRAAFKAPQAIAKQRTNPWVVNGSTGPRFAHEKWRQWLEQEFYAETQKEVNTFARFHKKLLGRRHPELHNKINAYLALLLHYSRLATIQIYEKNRVPLHPGDTSRIDTFGLENDAAVLANMQQLLQQSYRLLELPSPALDFFKE